jgi:glycosyltransferase involved in cell wall biosynthesis
MNHEATNGANCSDIARRAFPRRPRVLLSAYSCCPNRGSEPGIGWSRAVEIAKYCDTWVLTEGNDWQPRISAYLEEHGPIPNLHFIYVRRKRWEKAVEYTRMLSYVAYRHWLRRAYHAAEVLHAQVGFDIAHQITIATFREPCYLYRLGIPFVWGPVGGAQNYPWRFLAGAGFLGACLEATRSIVSAIQLYASPRVRTAAKSAAVIFSSSSDNQRRFRRALGIDSLLLCDVGATGLPIEFARPRSNSEAIRILWAGLLTTRKALELLIEALALLPENVPYELRVIGDGHCRKRWQRLAARRGVSQNIRWFGQLSYRDTLEQFHWADVFAFTSLRDTTGTVVLEAMAAAKPVICLDHQGVGQIVTDECGIRIPVTNRREVEKRLCDSIVRLQKDSQYCDELGRQAQKRATRFFWSSQARRIVREYNRVLESVGSDARCRVEDELNSQRTRLQAHAPDTASSRVASATG